jgi:predicted NBD/HSP70 family sugar kinase
LFDSLEKPEFFDVTSFKQSDSYKKDLDNLSTAIRELTRETIQGIGLGVPGILNKDKSGIKLSSNLPHWNGKPVKSDLSDRFNCSVVLDNDVTTAALGEALFGHGVSKDFLFIVWGTGIGGTAVHFSNKQPQLVPFEPGHHTRDWNGPNCPCGQIGCFELTCAGAGIKRHFGKPAEELNEKEWDGVVTHFTHGLMNIIMIRPTELIVLSGGIAVKQAKRIKKIKSILQKRLTIYPVPEIKNSKFQEDIGLYGALGLLKDQV